MTKQEKLKAIQEQLIDKFGQKAFNRVEIGRAHV